MERKFSRREFIKRSFVGFGVAGIAALGCPFRQVSAREKSISSASPALDSKSYSTFSSEEIRLEVLRNLSDGPFYSVLKGRCSDVFETDDGTIRILFRNGLVESVEPGNTSEFRVAPVYDEFSHRGLDERLFKESGLVLPPDNTYAVIERSRKTRFFKKASDFVVHPEVPSYAEWLKNNRGLDCGQLRGALRLSGKEIYRCANLTFIKEGRDINLSSVAGILWDFKLLPQEVFEPYPTDDSDKEVLYRFRDGTYDIPALIRLFAQSEPVIPVERADNICFCESKRNPNAENTASGADGLWQVLPSTAHAWHYKKHGWDMKRDGKNAYRNTIVATEIKDEEGVRAWSC